MPVDCCVPQGSVLRLLFVLVYINELVNCDMKHMNNWLRANKVSLNVEKTELVIKRLYSSNSINYVVVKIDIFLY